MQNFSTLGGHLRRWKCTSPQDQHRGRERKQVTMPSRPINAKVWRVCECERGLEGSIQNINLCKLMTNNCCFQQNFLLSLPTDCFWFCLLEIYLHCRSGRADVFALPSTMLFHFGFASGADHFFLRFLSSEFRQQKSKFRFHSGEDGQCHLIAANVIRISGPWFHHHGRSSRFRFRAGRSTWNSK